METLLSLAPTLNSTGVNPTDEICSVILPAGTFNENLPSALVVVEVVLPLTFTVADITPVLDASFTEPLSCLVCAFAVYPISRNNMHFKTLDISNHV